MRPLPPQPSYIPISLSTNGNILYELISELKPLINPLITFLTTFVSELLSRSTILMTQRMEVQLFACKQTPVNKHGGWTYKYTKLAKFFAKNNKQNKQTTKMNQNRVWVRKKVGSVRNMQKEK